MAREEATRERSRRISRLSDGSRRSETGREAGSRGYGSRTTTTRSPGGHGSARSSALDSGLVRLELTIFFVFTH